MNPRTPLVRLLAAVGVAATLAAACAPTSDDARPVRLTLMTHDSFDVSTTVLEAFTATTGVEVDLLPLGDAGSALNQAILTADAPQGDLLFGVDSSFLGRALDSDLFLPYRSAELAAVDPSTDLDPSGRLTPVDRGEVCLNLDRVWFEERGLAPPTDLADLTDDRYAGLTVVQDPSTSSPGLVFLLATIARFGEEGAFRWWEDMRASDVRVVPGWSDAYYASFTLHGGDRPIVVSYASSPAAEVHFADPRPARAPTDVVEASCYRQVEFVGILASTEHPDEARLLVDHLLGRTFQEDVPLTMFVWPVRLDARLPDVFLAHAADVTDPLELDPALVDARRDDWIRRWTTTVLR
jgi:thiamine transport system substrate-binding protein